MDRALVGRFINLREMLGDRDYLAATIVFTAAPTLVGIKPATLLSFTADGRDLRGLWDKYRDGLHAGLALECCELARTASSTRVLFYRRGLLERLLSDRRNASFLADLGYGEGMTAAGSLRALREKFSRSCPPEAGIFLGIPVEDVRGFMEHGGKEYLLSGYWKVYSDPDRAGRIFRAYDRARSAALAALCSRIQCIR